jgi:hypothetical protein
MNAESKTKYVILGVVAVLAVVAVIYVINPRSDVGSRMDMAAEELSDGVEDAGRELDPDRTPGEKIGDAIDDVGEGIEDATDN